MKNITHIDRCTIGDIMPIPTSVKRELGPEKSSDEVYLFTDAVYRIGEYLCDNNPTLYISTMKFTTGTIKIIFYLVLAQRNKGYPYINKFRTPKSIFFDGVWLI